MDKSIFNFKIMKSDGAVIDLHEDKNIWVSSFRIFSPSPEHLTDSTDGRNGSIYFGTTIKERKITCSLMIEADDEQEFDLVKDDIFNNIFNPLEKFYIIRDLQPEKRIEVSVSSEFNIAYLSLEDGEFDIDFVIHSVFIESLYSTIEQNFAQISGSRIQKYKHSTSSFEILNDGVIAIDPKIFPFIITFTGTSTNLTIKNLTTGDEWSFTGTTAASDSIELDGVRATKNGLSIFRNTNRKLITLAPGWNEFQLIGASGTYSISFDFRFYTF